MSKHGIKKKFAGKKICDVAAIARLGFLPGFLNQVGGKCSLASIANRNGKKKEKKKSAETCYLLMLAFVCVQSAKIRVGFLFLTKPFILEIEKNPAI